MLTKYVQQTAVYVPLKKPFWITYVEWKFHFDNVIKPTFGKHTRWCPVLMTRWVNTRMTHPACPPIFLPSFLPSFRRFFCHKNSRVHVKFHIWSFCTYRARTILIRIRYNYYIEKRVGRDCGQKKKTKRSHFDRKTRITLITLITSGFYYDGYRARVTNRIRNQGEFVTRADRRNTRRHQPASFCWYFVNKERFLQIFFSDFYEF